MKLSHRLRQLCAALALVGLAGAAQADPLRITPAGDAFDLVQSSAYSGPAAMWSVRNLTTDESFLAFCLELLQGADQSNAQEYTASSYAPSAPVRELYDRFYGSVQTSAATAVGFQLALWDLLGQATVADFTTGLAGAKTAAQAMLDTVNGSDTGYQPGQYEFRRWSSAGFQDVLQVVPGRNEVPEPATHALVVSGLGLLLAGVATRRRRGRPD